MKICFVPSDMDAPGCYRCLFPARQLSLHGHQVVMPPRTEHLRDDDRMVVEFQVQLSPPDPYADIWVLQQRKERMWPEGGVQALRTFGVVTVADVDDNYLELPEYNPAFYGTHPYRRDDGVILSRQQRRAMEKKLGAKIPPNKHNVIHMHEMFRRVDALTVSTPYLAELYSKYNSNIRVIRNYLDWDIWADITPQYEVERPRTRIGYLGVFKYRQGDLDVIRDVIPKFMRKHPEVDFVANTEAVHDYLGVPKDQRVTVGEYSFRPRDGGKYPVGEKTAVLDIGLVPLAMNGLNQAKSHLKGMEYNAAGVPFIASPTESYEDYWCDDSNGLLAANGKDWFDHLEELVSDGELRRRMGRYGREKASRHTMQEHYVEWEAFYRELLGDEWDYIARQAIARGAVQKASELGALLRLVAGACPETVVEIGSARGGTFWALTKAASPDALLVSIDIPGGSALDRTIGTGEDRYGGRDRDRIARMGRDNQRVVLMDENSQLADTREKLEKILGGRQIDLLFIDGDHTLRGATRDFELYEPLVADGGLIAFHDIIPQWDERARVHELWNHLKDRYDASYEFVGRETWGYGKWAGIGVIRKEGALAASAK